MYTTPQLLYNINYDQNTQESGNSICNDRRCASFLDDETGLHGICNVEDPIYIKKYDSLRYRKLGHVILQCLHSKKFSLLKI